ncbi:hypothetical protein BKA70DRAFT_1562774 [Coprinopsis sp. MPI-PUGE-AT-0042]|nr:hypothetical protein BKA70DRAFT_1562774 [Coprinopsis sp. MPI-PUGE-AT-0042]
MPVATWAAMLTSALGFMPNLRHFVLEGEEQMEELIHQSPQFFSALLARPSLKTFFLGNIGTEASTALGKFCSTLTSTLNLEAVALFGATYGDLMDTPLQVSPKDGLGVFLRHPHTLWQITSLCLNTLNLDPFVALGHGNSSVLFPSLNKLELGKCSVPLSWLAAVAPGIQTLSIYCCQIYGSTPFPQLAFPQLVHLAASFHDVSTLMYSNAVSLQQLHCLRLGLDWGNPGEQDTTEPFAIAKAASNLQSVTLKQIRIRPLSWWQGFGQVLPPLKSLKISLDAASVDEVHVARCEIPGALATVPLEYVSLTIEGGDMLYDRPEYSNVSAASAEELIAISWATVIPTLQHIHVRLSRKALNPSLRIERGNSSVTVQVLGAHDGLKIEESFYEDFSVAYAM